MAIYKYMALIFILIWNSHTIAKKLPTNLPARAYKKCESRFQSDFRILCEWEHTGSNRGPSACKADALNQLSYAPFPF